MGTDGDSRLSRLRQVRLERFKAAFRPAEIPLGQFTVIIGRNGSGKSTLLEALQWLDTTFRRDAREACERYHGVSDLVNLRSDTSPLYFKIELSWTWDETAKTNLAYGVRVEDRSGIPLVAGEEFSLRDKRNRKIVKLIETRGMGERIRTGGAKFSEPDRLALQRLAGGEDPNSQYFRHVADFWKGAVFLRLSTGRLAEGSLATRKSFEPLLDEEGQNLPALLNELTRDQKQGLVTDLSRMLPGIKGVKVSRAGLGRDVRVHYSLEEEMPYRGRRGEKQFPIPAWMLSEGSRRITALLALLRCDPHPSLLCIEEVENGMDPQTVKLILRKLQDATDRGVQVILTTHSPWVLDDVPMESILLVRREGGDTAYHVFKDLPEIKEFDPSLPPGTLYTNVER